MRSRRIVPVQTGQAHAGQAHAGQARAGHGPAGQAGFMLIEVLVAVVVAALFLSALGRALAGAWGATRTPADVLAAATLGRAELARLPAEPPTSRDAPRGFAIARHTRAAVIEPRPFELAPQPPAPVVATASRLPRNDVMPGVTHHPPGPDGPTGQFQQVSVTVRTPAGRAVTLDTLRLDVAPN